jgi:hypothetical protein
MILSIFLERRSEAPWASVRMEAGMAEIPQSMDISCMRCSIRVHEIRHKCYIARELLTSGFGISDLLLFSVRSPHAVLSSQGDLRSTGDYGRIEGELY